jgi:hypothetical protein
MRSRLLVVYWVLFWGLAVAAWVYVVVVVVVGWRVDLVVGDWMSGGGVGLEQTLALKELAVAM